MSLMDITSANATAIMTVESLFPAGFEWQQYATDNAIDLATTELAVVRIGVDGHMAAGFKHSVKQLTVNFEAGSKTLSYIDKLVARMETGMRIYACQLVVTVPSIGKVYTYTDGTLTSARQMAPLKQVLDPRDFIFSFAKIIPQDI